MPVIDLYADVILASVNLCSIFIGDVTKEVQGLIPYYLLPIPFLGVLYYCVNWDKDFMTFVVDCLFILASFPGSPLTPMKNKTKGG